CRRCPTSRPAARCCRPSAARCGAAWRRSTTSSATRPTATTPSCSTRGTSRRRASTPSGASPELLVLPDPYGERACPSVAGVVAVRRVLHLLVRGHDLFHRPVIQAVALPVPDVARPRAHRDRGVVGRAAAKRLGARNLDLRGGSYGAGGEAPLMLGVGRHVRGSQKVVWIAIEAVGRARME